MAIQVTTRVIVEITGSLDSIAVSHFVYEVNKITSKRNITLDFKGLSYISSPGLYELNQLQKKVISNGGKFFIINV